MRPGLSTVAAALLLAACASEPVADDELAGVETPVEVLDAGFVRFEGERIALEWFLLEMRRRARAAQWEPARMPRVEVRIADGAAGVDGRWFSAFSDELRKAGIHSTVFR